MELLKIKKPPLQNVGVRAYVHGTILLNSYDKNSLCPYNGGNRLNLITKVFR